MSELALMVFFAAIGLYVAAVLTKRRPLYFLPFLLSVCSVVLVITDTAVSDVELLVVIVVDFYVFLMSLASLVIKGVNDRWRRRIRRLSYPARVPSLTAATPR